MLNCIKCNKGFKTNQHLQRHLNRKNACDKEYNCINCLKVFKTNQQLTQHKNRKNKCKKVDYKQEIIELKNKLEEKTQQTIINNNIHIDNLQINVYDTGGKIHYKYFLNAKPLESLDIAEDIISKLSIESDTDYTDDLSNIYNFTNMIKAICFNMDIPDNWIICKDELFNKLKLKVDDNNVVNCVDNMLSLIYTVAKQVVKSENLDVELLLFYNSFIVKYETKGFAKNDNLKIFIKKCNDELFNHYSDIINIINARRNNKKQIEYDINNFGEEDIRFIKKSIIDMELNSILEKKYPDKIYNNSLKVNELRYYGIMDVKMIDMFVYFLKLIYNNNDQISNKTIDYVEDKFLIYNNKKWTEIKSKNLVNQIFSKIHQILKMNKIKLTEGVYTEDYVIESFKEKYTMHYTVGDVKKYGKILKEYYLDNHTFDDHEKNMI